jgi:hypothetical protein
MSSFTEEDLLNLEDVLCEEDFSICHEVFEKNNSLLEFLEADDLDLAYGRTQSRLKHLITVVKPWSCVEKKVMTFTETTGICLGDPSPCTLVWKGLCTIGCSLCNALKNYALRNDYCLGRGWKYRAKYLRMHGNLISTIIHFLEHNIVQMVNKHNQNIPLASDQFSSVHIEPTVTEDPEAIIENPVTHDRNSLLSEVEPFKSMFSGYVNTDHPLTDEEVYSLFEKDEIDALLLDHVNHDESRLSLPTK